MCSVDNSTPVDIFSISQTPSQQSYLCSDSPCASLCPQQTEKHLKCWLPVLPVRMSNALRALDDIKPHGQHFYGSFPLSSEDILASNPTSIRGYLSVQRVIYICSHSQNVNKQCLQVLVLNLPLISQIKHSITCSYILPVSSGRLKLNIYILYACACISVSMTHNVDLQRFRTRSQQPPPPAAT